jgi:hypothetical protein
MCEEERDYTREEGVLEEIEICWKMLKKSEKTKKMKKK